MPLGKIGKEVLGTLAEEIAEEAPKRAPRKTLKDVTTPPEELKQLPIEERVEKVGEFFEEPKAEAYTKARQEDIKQDRRATFAEQEKVSTRIETTPIEEADRMAMLQERKRDLYLKASNLKKERILLDRMNQVKAEGGSALDSAIDLISNTPGAGKQFSNIESRAGAIYNRVNADMFEVKEGLRTKWLGLSQDTELADDVIRYLKDGAVKNNKRLSEIKEIADQWTKGAEKLKALRNRAGARIGKLEDWILPQSHDARKIQKAGLKEWSGKIRDKLDKERIESEQGLPLEDVLETAYKNITTRNVDAGQGMGGAVVAKRGESHRVLHFKTGDDMINYKNEFGNPDTFSTMDSHVRQQANEIASLQIFGSNPDAMFEKIKQIARADGLGSIQEGHLNRAWALSTGQADGDDIITQMDSAFALVGGTHRAVSVASKLGSATITALGDLSNMIIGSKYRGIGTIKMLGKGLDTLIQEATTIGKVGKNIELANRIGVVSEFASASLANSRYAEVGAGAAQKAAEVVIRGSGLGSYTNSMRTAVGLEFSANFAENFGNKLDDTPFVKMFEEYGITAKEWDIIRKTQPHETKGAKFLDVNKIYEVDEELGYRMNELITNEMDAFVIMPTDRTRIWTTWGAKKGTVMGEAARNMMLFRSFPIAITMMHMKRLGQIDSTAGKVAYGSAILGVNTIMGGITLFAYDIVTGKTPRDPKRPEMVYESLMKTGALGIYGDLLFGDGQDRYGHNYMSTFVGVPAGTLEDLAKTAYRTVTDPTNPTTWANNYNTAKQYIPGQNLWYTRAVMEATIGEFFGKLIDPKYNRKQHRRQKYMRQRGQEFLLK